MAKKFFNQKVKKSKRQNAKIGLLVTGIVAIILVIVLAIFLVYNANKQKLKNAVIEVRDAVGVEINSELPDKTLFFSELKGVKEKDIKTNLNKLKISEVGNFEVTLKIYGKKFKSILQVVDTTAPVLELKDVTITKGSTYKIEDFVESCTDNSKKDCKIEYFQEGIDQNSNSIDYSNYSNEGTYIIKIVASDESGNVTNGEAKLTIGANQTTNPVCKYGNNKYDADDILSVDVTENGCALSLDLYKNEKVIAAAQNLIELEKEKLHKEFSKVTLNVKDIYLNSSIDPILNTEKDGLVGYSVFIEVSILNKAGNKEVIESFYLNKDGSRKYLINKYL